ncbi:LysR family transcriptional regulator [Shewanella eurypsychrophilus]|uniref:LysR family transcriptional regulator n=1 Tax=Shewanella eurypsychrophilus TaxID=2593656 RepID=A0ABX6V5Y9_9GAMM|nr:MULTISPECIES: DNA-binding transcriptional activator PunR [Shewanella]QFU22769.1 LysR family transcriptional regulator [Shewanella sp. YLB-09]QPG58058.1 LysR family transcriptional regulator [Shewanella eurypsychrophilus]
MLSEQSMQLIDMVARVGSFTAAANKLHKVPSAVSYAVKQVESDLGVSLFERHHRSVSLTPAGEHFVKQIRKVLTNMAAIKDDTKRIANGWQPTLSIAFDNIVRADKISVLIADFYRNFTNIELIIRIEVFNGVWESIASGRSDIAIGATTAIPVGGDYHFRDMGEIEWAFIVSKKHPLAQIDRPLMDDELREYPTICLEDTSREIPKRMTWLLENQRRLVVPDWIRAINCFREGLGIGYIPLHFAEPFIKTGALIQKEIERPKAPSPCCMAWNGANKSPAMSWVLDYLGDSKKLHHDWFL